MRILIVNTLYYPYKVGGAEVSVRLLAEALVKVGNEVTVVSIHEHKIEKRDLINGVNVIYLPYSNIYWQFGKEKNGMFSRLAWHFLDNYNFLVKDKINDIITEFNPDIVHTNNLSGISVAIWDVAKKHNCKIVHTSRDYYLLHPNCKMYKDDKDMQDNDISVKIWSFIKKWKSKHVNVYVGISDYIKNRHLKAGFFPKANTITIYNAVEGDENINLQLEVGEQKIQNIGFIGRLTKEKGFDIFCELAKKNKNKKFIAAGEFENNNDGLRELAEACGVELLGHYPVIQFMQKIELLVLPIKWQEPFGRVVIEGITAGKSILTNKVGGITELANILPNIYFFEDISNLDDVPKYKNILSDSFKIFTSKSVANEYLKVYKGLSHG
ncbi:TPA: glycosyltransferase family 4 protein [Raoultella planticola]|jgi:glycosyltransferase involved in cell wall biosynthesis|uniref:glycosyltransferase family 4 protein n=1 Tax=Raoultella ornithinolytica TaxID=54291 RepID=UPI002946B016|nr:glycosyltransferase family 4 protein [Raoultella ornithinolytica]